MIFDSPEQQQFVFKILRAYVCPYAESLDINQKFAPAIQGGAVVPQDKQQQFLASLQPKKAVEVTPPAKPDPSAGSKNGKSGKKEEKSAEKPV